VAASPQNTMFPERPVLDEATFQQLLAAAYVLQEHNDRIQARSESHNPAPVPVQERTSQPAGPDYARTLSEIVETQALIQTHHLDLEAAILLLAQRVQAMTKASGTAIGMIEENQICYRAAAGNASREADLRVPVDLALSAECLRTGAIVQYSDAEDEPCLSTELCQRTETKSLIAVPIHHDNRVAGVLEVRFDRRDGFSQHDVRTSQLMAGLAAEALSRAAEMKWKRALVDERTTMMDVLEKLKPQLDRLATAVLPPRPETQPQPAMEAEPAAEPVLSCRGCGETVGQDEAFCGVCGMRVAPGGDIQSKWASMWHLKEASEHKKSAAAAGAGTGLSTGLSAIEDTSHEFSTSGNNTGETLAITMAVPQQESADAELVTGSDIDRPWRWTSASHAKTWLDSVKSPSDGRLQRLWKDHRAKVYVAIAAMLLLLAISGWGTSGTGDGTASASTSTAQKGKHAPKPRLTLFEQTLVTLGLAEAPSTPAYRGDPDIAVWEDIHTATYYCPGADLYGKTPGGKYSTQREAQQDQFEPASRRVCR